MGMFDWFSMGDAADAGAGLAGDVGGSVAQAAAAGSAGGFFGDISFGDIGDTLGLAFGDMMGGLNSGMPDWITGSSAFGSLMPSMDTLEKTNAAKDSGGGLLDKVGGFVEKNKTLSELALKGFGGAVAARNAKDAAKAGSRSRIEELQMADQLKQQDNARVSASVSGLRSPGLVNKQMALKRIDGTPIYQNGKVA